MSKKYMPQQPSVDLRIAVVLSTYNGTKYLSDLIESIQKQTYSHWDIWIRDDGSTDTTHAVLDQIQQTWLTNASPNDLFFFKGENKGAVGSYFSLLSMIDKPYAAYAFCDQDDIWLPDKLERAAEALSRHESKRPFLYHARQYLLHETGQVTKKSPLPKHMGFSNALIENQVVGCSLVMNSSLKHLMLNGFIDTTIGDKKEIREHNNSKKDPLNQIIMHDWWCYLLASAFGTIEYDPEPAIIFRRHSDTTTATSLSAFKEFINRFRHLSSRSFHVHHILRQVTLFYRIYGFAHAPKQAYTLTDNHLGMIKPLLAIPKSSLFKKIRYLFSLTCKRSRMLETYIFRLLLLRSGPTYHNED